MFCRFNGPSISLMMTLFIAAAFPGCSKPEPPAPQPPEVTVALPVVKDVTSYREFTGRLEEMESVEIRARVEGYLQSIEFTEASEVKEGDLLYVIDPREYEAHRDKAKAALISSNAELENAEMDLERVLGAAESGAVSQREVSRRTADRDKAKADVEAAKAALTEAELDLEFTRITSPIDGRINRTLVTRGNLVGAGEYTLLTTVVKMDPIYAYFEIPEKSILADLAEKPMAARKDAVRAAFLALSHETEFTHEGVLDYIDNTINASTGTLTVRGTFSNKSELLFPGAFARIRVPDRINKEAVLVEERAIGTDLGGKYVLVVNEQSIVEHRPIEMGALIDGMRVVESGIEPEESYIVNGLLRARPGLPVRPMRSR